MNFAQLGQVKLKKRENAASEQEEILRKAMRVQLCESPEQYQAQMEETYIER
jgi:hypothetical protein